MGRWCRKGEPIGQLARCVDVLTVHLWDPPQLVTVGWDFKASVWQKDQLVTQLQWQENGPTSSNTPYRYQACRCAGPRVADRHTSLGSGKGPKKLGMAGVLLEVVPGVTGVQGTNLRADRN